MEIPNRDELDVRIVTAVRQDPKLSNRALARQLGVSEATVRKRLRALDEDGVLKRSYIINPYKLGYELDTIIGLHVDIAQIKQVAANLATFDNVRLVAVTSGSFDIMVAALFRSREHLMEFVTEHLAKISGIREIETSHLLMIVKRTHDWIPSTQMPAVPSSAPSIDVQAASRAQADVSPDGVTGREG